MKYFLLLFAAFLSCSSYAGISRGSGGNYILENRYFRVTVSPRTGGRIISLKSRITGKEYTSPASDLGIGGLADWQDRSVKRSQWFGGQYGAEVIKKGKISILQLERLGTGTKSWVTAGIVYELAEDSSTLRIRYRISVDPNAMASIPFCIWMHNSIQVKNEKAEIALPAPEGIRKIGLDMTVPQNESFHYDAADGWFSFKCLGSDEGLVFSAPWEKLMCFYNWQGSDGNTMEMMFHSQSIEHGKTFELPVDITLFRQKTALDGAGSGLTGSFCKEKNQISGANIYSAFSRTIHLEFSRRAIPGVLETPLEKHSLDCSAGKSIDVKLNRTLKASALEEVICRARDKSGKLLMTMRTALAADGKQAKYIRLPEGRKTADTSERFGKRLAASLAMKDCYKWNFDLPLAGNSTPWLKPYTGGKLRLLILTDMLAGREAIELAGRMDAEAESCTFSGMGWLDWHPLWAGRDGAAETNIFLSNLLKKKWDAILISGIQIDKISKENRKRIAELVRSGTGLVSIMPTSIPKSEAALFPAVPLLKKPVYQRKEPRLKTSGKFSGQSKFPGVFPFDSLPQVMLFPYKSKSAAVTSGKQPFYCTGTFGSGKTALFTWLVGRPDNTNRGGIMPFQNTTPHFAAQDYYYGMIIKALLWSADRKPAAAIRSVKCTEQQVVIEIDNRSSEKITAALELSARSVTNAKIVPAGKFIRELSAGVNRVTLPLQTKNMLNGVNLLDIRLKIKDLAADFAAASLNIKRNAAIAAVKIPEKVYRENQKIPVEIRCSGNLSQAELSTELTDRYGRVVCTGAAVRLPADGKVTIELVPQGIYSRTGKVTLKLIRNGKLLDLKEQQIDLLPPAFASREWKDYRVMLSWPQRANRVLPFHLRPIWENTLKELGINAILGYAIPVWWGHDDEENRLICRGDFVFVAESIARISKRTRLPYCTNTVFDYRWRSREFRQMMTQYNKTLDKKYLRRNPTLEDKTFIEAYTNALRQYLPTIAHLHPALYDFGDEMSYGLFSNPMDFDFSESSLRQFRKWLATQYRSIDELNAEWKRSYKSFDEVIPDTAVEARERNVFAAWGMHRIYGSKVFTDFLRLTAQTIKEVDKGAKVTMSGTQEPKPYNGYDWSKLMPLFDSVTAYTMNGMPEIMRSFKQIPTIGWSGYGSSRNSVSRQIWNNAFNGHFGVALYNEMVMLNPDLTLTGHAKDLRSAFMPLKNGIGTLLYNSGRKKPEIAIHYSQSSAVASWIEQAVGDFSSSRLNWINLIKSLGFNMKFVSTQDIENGILSREKFKGFVMPYSLALSGKEREAVSSFIRSGGAVFADIAPGKWTNRFVKTSSLDSRGITITGPLPGDITSAAAAALQKNIRKKLGAEENISYLQLSHGAEIHQFDLGKNGGNIFAFWNVGSGTVSTTLPPGKYLYDVLNRKLISKKSFQVTADTPGVYVLLPYRVDGVSAVCEQKKREITIRIKVSAKAKTLTRHVFLVEIFRDGKKFMPYSAVIDAPDGHAVHRFHTGIGEKNKISFRITDIVSGQQTQGDL